MIKTKLLKRYLLLTMIIVGISLVALLVNVLLSLSQIENINMYRLLIKILYVIVLASIQFILCYTYIKHKPFYTGIDRILLFLSIIILFYAFFLPKFSEHIQFVPFRIMDNGAGYLIDGWYLLVAMLVFLFSRITRYGTTLQEEVDDLV